MTDEIKRLGVHHSFDVDLAKEFKNTDLAILTHHFQFWIRHNAALNKNTHDGKTWTFMTIKDIAATFPYWSYKQVERYIIKLVELKVLIKGNYNNSPYDRTVWYAFKDEEKFSISRNREIEITESGNQIPEIGTPIPDTLHITKKKKKKKDAALAALEFNYELKEFVGISETDKVEWQKLYPGVDISRELDLMRQWLMNPDTPERDGNRSFIINWLTRSLKDLQKHPSKTAKQSSSTKVPENKDNALVPSYIDDPVFTYDPSVVKDLLNSGDLLGLENFLRCCTDKTYYLKFIASKDVK